MADYRDMGDGTQATVPLSGELVDGVRRYFQSRDFLRRGICLLNAGCTDQAENAFREALRLNPGSCDLPQYLARACVRLGKFTAAAEAAALQADRDREDVGARVRQALLLWKGGDPSGAIGVLRSAVDSDPECAEFHFQLGTLLASQSEVEEAELRFTTAVTLDPQHTDALVSLALCHGASGAPDQACALLERAQHIRPHDARIGLLLTQARRALGTDDVGSHRALGISAPDRSERNDGMTGLREMVQGDPELVEALIEPADPEIDEELFLLLLNSVSAALDDVPDSAALHLGRGRILKRMGRTEPAIESVERALLIDPESTPAMIRLAQLYRDAGRRTDARVRFEQVIGHGAHYADVYLQLGDLYRDEGRIDRARDAYRRALTINSRYQAAREALATLPA